MALDGESVASIVTDSSLSDEARERTLYAGAGTQAPRLPAANGPWSVMIPGAAYMRFVVHGGNLRSDNEMQIRVLPQQPSAAFLATQEPHLMLTGFQPAATAQPSPITVLRWRDRWGLYCVSTLWNCRYRSDSLCGRYWKPGAGDRASATGGICQQDEQQQ